MLEEEERVKIGMDSQDGFGYDIQALLPYWLEGFTQWKVRIEIFFQVNIDNWFALMEEFEASKDKKEKPFWKRNGSRSNSRDLRNMIR